MQSYHFTKNEMLDVSALFKSVKLSSSYTGTNYYHIVSDLLKETYLKRKYLKSYLNQIREDEYNSEEWERICEKHNIIDNNLLNLQIILSDLLIDDIEENIALNDNICIDIKQLLIEMPSDIGIGFIKEYIEMIERVEREVIYTGEDNSQLIEELNKLKNQLTIIFNEEVEIEKEWRKNISEILDAEHQREREIINSNNIVYNG